MHLGGLRCVGNPLGAGKEITATGTADGSTGAAGYAILQAENLAGAQALLDTHTSCCSATGSVRTGRLF